MGYDNPLRWMYKHLLWPNAGALSLPLRAGGTDLVVLKVCVSENGPSPASLIACILKL